MASSTTSPLKILHNTLDGKQSLFLGFYKCLLSNRKRFLIATFLYFFLLWSCTKFGTLVFIYDFDIHFQEISCLFSSIHSWTEKNDFLEADYNWP